MEGFHRQESGIGKLLAKEKKGSLQARLPILGKGRRGLITSVDQEIPEDCLKVTFPGGAESAIKSWLAVLGASDPTLGLLLFL